MRRAHLLTVTLLAISALTSTVWAASVDSTDTQGPGILYAGVDKQVVRVSIDSTVTLTAAASDVGKGGSSIAGGEYYVEIDSTGDPGPGNGIAMRPYDGNFDSTNEVMTAAVDVSSWTSDRTIFVRAKDSAGNWGGERGVGVTVTTDITPPGRINDLSAAPVGSLMPLHMTVSEWSSVNADNKHPVTAVLDDDSATSWRTIGTTIPQTEYITLDTVEEASVCAITLGNGSGWRQFPTDIKVETSPDGEEWEGAVSLKIANLNRLRYVCEFEPTIGTRYIKMSGPGIRNAADGRYYWDIADIGAYTSDGMLVQLKWTAPADSGYFGPAAARYDVRYSTSEMTSDSFAKSKSAYGLGAPAVPGPDQGYAQVQLESSESSINMAMKTADQAGNWSEMSNPAAVTPSVTGFESLSPDDEDTSTTAVDRPTFTFRIEPSVNPVSIVFSDRRDFPPRPTAGEYGWIDRSMRIPVNPRRGSWTPSAGQWKAIKALVPPGGTLFWRLEGVANQLIGIIGPTRSIVFDTGMITGLAVDPSHYINSTDALWPDRSVKPTFSWANLSTEMKYFFVDVSIDSTASFRDPARTISLNSSGVTGEEYTVKKDEWRRIRKLATKGSGLLHWRVRARDAQRALVSVSDETLPLIIDGGTWTVQPPTVDPAVHRWALSCTHAGDSENETGGITRFQWQFSVDDTFAPTARKTLTVPSVPLRTSLYTMSAAEVRRIQAFMAANHLTQIYYRVKGADADGAFVTYSPGASFTP